MSPSHLEANLTPTVPTGPTNEQPNQDLPPTPREFPRPSQQEVGGISEFAKQALGFNISRFDLATLRRLVEEGILTRDQGDYIIDRAKQVPTLNVGKLLIVAYDQNDKFNEWFKSGGVAAVLNNAGSVRASEAFYNFGDVALRNSEKGNAAASFNTSVPSPAPTNQKTPQVSSGDSGKSPSNHTTSTPAPTGAPVQTKPAPTPPAPTGPVSTQSNRPVAPVTTPSTSSTANRVQPEQLIASGMPVKSAVEAVSELANLFKATGVKFNREDVGASLRVIQLLKKDNPNMSESTLFYAGYGWLVRDKSKGDLPIEVFANKLKTAEGAQIINDIKKHGESLRNDLRQKADSQENRRIMEIFTSVDEGKFSSKTPLIENKPVNRSNNTPPNASAAPEPKPGSGIQDAKNAWEEFKAGWKKASSGALDPSLVKVTEVVVGFKKLYPELSEKDLFVLGAAWVGGYNYLKGQPQKAGFEYTRSPETFVKVDEKLIKELMKTGKIFIDRELKVLEKEKGRSAYTSEQRATIQKMINILRSAI